MTPKQVNSSIGKVVEWEGKLWYLLGSVRSKGEFGLSRRVRTWAIVGARGEQHEVPPRSLKLADYPGQREGD